MLGKWRIGVLIVTAILYGTGMSNGADIRGKTIVSGFDSDVPVAYEDALLSLRFEGIRPIGTGTGDVVVELRKVKGVWATARGVVAAADYNERSRNKVDGLELVQNGMTVAGRVTVTIGPDGARRGRAHFPSPYDRFQLEFSAEIATNEFASWHKDRESFMPGWRKDTPVYSGLRVTGEYRGQAELSGSNQQQVAGKISGAMNRRPAAGQWGAAGSMRFEPLNPGLLAVAAGPAERTDKGAGAWLERRFDKPLDWSKYDTIAITAGPADGSGGESAPLLVAAVHAGDSWYECRPVAQVSAQRHTWLIPFKRFSTGWRHPDWSSVKTFKIGVDIFRGGGERRFHLYQISLRQSENYETQPSSIPLYFTLDPGTVISFNEQDSIPKGLFGMHDVNGQRIDLSDGSNPVEYARELRPGFLRPLTHVQFGREKRGAESPIAEQEVSQLFLERAAAADALDNVIWCHTADLWARPPWMEQGLDHASEAVAGFYAGLAAQAWRPGEESNVLRRFEFWNEPFMWGRHINMGFRRDPGEKEWNDPTQYGNYPGQVGADAWSKLFKAARSAALEVNEHVEMGGPSAPAFWGDHYGVLTNYVQRILLETGNELDFITEHHYGGDPRAAAASYEVLAGWCRINLGRIIPVYNTEANAHLSGGSALRAAYNIGDIFSCAAICPDKNLGRALHAMWSGVLRNAGEEHAWRWMAPLRGKRLYAEVDDPAVTILAVTPEPGRWYLALFNLGHEPRRLNAVWPEGFSCGTVEYIETGVLSAATELETDYDTAPAKDSQAVRRYAGEPLEARDGRLRLELAGRSGVRIEFLRESWRPERVLLRRQLFADIYCRRVTRGEKIPLRLLDRPEMPVAGWSSTRLRVVSSGLQPHAAMIQSGEMTISLPASSGNEGEAIVHDLLLPRPLDTDKDELQLVVAADADVLPFEILTLSLIVEERKGEENEKK